MCMCMYMILCMHAQHECVLAVYVHMHVCMLNVSYLSVNRHCKDVNSDMVLVSVIPCPAYSTLITYQLVRIEPARATGLAEHIKKPREFG